MPMEDALLSGDKLALSRFLTRVENGESTALETLDRLYPRSGKAHRIGITGAPGTGKSSLVNQLTRHIRAATGKKVAVVAIDPSSPFTGGAILGDRVRMRDLAGDSGVFIRSMASRGAVGGLAVATAKIVQAFDSVGYDLILVETVGAGQSEIDIARLAHTTLVVEAPGFGDEIQAIKAGIMEIADILIVNKADLPGAENTERALRNNLEMGYTPAADLMKSGHRGWEPASEGQETQGGWVPPILRTIATEENGIAEVWQAVERHFGYLKQSGKWEQLENERLHKELIDLIQSRLMDTWREKTGTFRMETALQKMTAKTWSPQQAADWLISSSN